MTAAITYLLDQLTSILRSDGQSEIGAAFGEMMDSLGEVLTASWDRLRPVLVDAFTTLWESLKPALSAALDSLYEEVIRPYGLWVVGAMLLLFAPQLVAGVLMQVVGAAITAVVTLVSGALGGIGDFAWSVMPPWPGAGSPDIFDQVVVVAAGAVGAAGTYDVRIECGQGDGDVAQLEVTDAALNVIAAAP
jgi:hypothetical protein